MKIKGKIKGDMVGFSLKHNPENGIRFANIQLAIGVDMDRCKSLFGDELARIAFGSLSIATGNGEDDVTGISFGYKKLEPDAICEYHEITIVGHKQSVQPVIKSIKPIKDEQKVTILIEFPILVKKDKELAGDLVAEFGELIEIEIDPAQRELNLDGDANKGDSAGVVITRGRFGNPKPAIADSSK